MKDLFVVLRSANERSVPLARMALEREKASYVQIEEYPFSAALKKMFSIAKDNPAKYLLALDADVILHEGALTKIIQEADKRSHFFFLDFFVMDKFRGKCCSGCHLYVNHYSNDLLNYLNDDATRPENQLVLNFSTTHQIKMLKSPLVVGLHDYEQYYRDLYAKYLRRALRRRDEAEMLIHVIEARKKYFPKDDRDFDVVLKGLHDGIKGNIPASFDARNYKNIEDLMPLSEKTGL